MIPLKHQIFIVHCVPTDFVSQRTAKTNKINFMFDERLKSEYSRWVNKQCFYYKTRNAVAEMSNGVHRIWWHAASSDDDDEMNNNKNKNAYFNLVAASRRQNFILALIWINIYSDVKFNACVCNRYVVRSFCYSSEKSRAIKTGFRLLLLFFSTNLLSFFVVEIKTFFPLDGFVYLYLFFII